MDYPHEKLPYPLVGQSRKQIKTFDTTPVFTSELRVRKLRSNSPVSWDMTWRLNGTQRVVFEAWLSTVLTNGNSNTFAMNIYTADGPVAHTVRFIEPPLEPRQVSWSVWEYSAMVYASKLLTPTIDALGADFVIEYFGDAQLLDTIVNVDMPEI